MCRRLVFAFLAFSVAFSVAGAELPWRFEGDVSRGPATFGVSAEPFDVFGYNILIVNERKCC